LPTSTAPNSASIAPWGIRPRKFPDIPFERMEMGLGAGRASEGRGQNPRWRVGLPRFDLEYSGQHALHHVQSTLERIKDQSQYFQGDSPEKGFISWLPKDDRRMPIPLREGDMTFRYRPFNFG